MVDKTERSVSVTEVYARLSNFTPGTFFFAGHRKHLAVIGRRVVWQMSFVRGRVVSCAVVCFTLCRALWAGELSAPVEHRRYLQRGALNLTRREQRTRKHGNMLLKSHLAYRTVRRASPPSPPLKACHAEASAWRGRSQSSSKKWQRWMTYCQK